MTRRARSSAVAFALLAGAGVPALAHAQDARRGDFLPPRATADSLRVLVQLDQLTRANPGDANAWFRRGVTAATLAKNAREYSLPRGITKTELDATAALSLKTAVALDSTNPAYWATLAKYYETGTPSERRQVSTVLHKVVSAGRAAGDTTHLVDALVQLGNRQNVDLAFTRTAERYLGHAFETAPRSVWYAAGKDTIKELPLLLKSATEKIARVFALTYPDPVATSTLRLAQDMFAEAYALAPMDSRLFPRLATLYVTGDQWGDLAMLARDRTQRAPADPWGWLALGLAHQRLRAYTAARAAFDAGLVRLVADERARLDRVDRVLTWHDSTALAKSDAATRERIAARTWEFGDPLWSVTEGKPREEFLARVVFADLRWGTDEKRGAETGLGETYIRYGPPDARRGRFWIYNSGLVFPGGESKRVREYPELNETSERIQDWQPSRWDNVTSMRVDSMRTQVARFRGGADAVEVMFAAQAPADAVRLIQDGTTRATARFWLRGNDTPVAVTDSGSLDRSGTMHWTQRVPAGEYYYRAESVIPGARLAGRTAGTLRLGAQRDSGFATTGFGMSDVLLATRVGAAERPARWQDARATPLIGDVRAGATIALVWETYDLTARDGSAEYDVKISIERKYTMFLNRVRARVISAFAAMVGTEQTADRIVYRYSRTAAHAPIIADHISLALEDIPVGNYELSLEITDKVTGAFVARAVKIVVVE